MPLYEYLCEECGRHIELLVQGSQTPECSECGSKKLAKQFSVPAAHVSGGNSLPIRGGDFGGCSKPGCGPGGCGMGMG
jgi:putative FmdB family regulatory protein